MKQDFCRWRIAVAALVLVTALLPASSPGSTYVQMTSAYLGGGWFQYDLVMQYEAFFSSMEMISWNPPFPNAIGTGTSSNGFVFANYTNAVAWMHEAVVPRHLTATFLVRSAETNVALTNGYWMFSAYPLAAFSNYFGVLSQNIAGYARLACLVPSSSFQSSATEVTDAVVLIDDPIVTAFTERTIQYEWPHNGTMLIEASRDLSTWSNIACTLAYPTVNTWTSSVPLETYGTFWRVGLIAGGHSSGMVFNTRALRVMPGD